MINTDRLKEILIGYKNDFVNIQWPKEKYKWEAVKWFKDHWDINAPNFAEILATTTKICQDV